uniref:Uncharacterized protein n=1 Tax=Caenorhabditis japonica TaxID=281687 RepID=A0A8R1ETR6_CAEJA
MLVRTRLCAITGSQGVSTLAVRNRLLSSAMFRHDFTKRTNAEKLTSSTTAIRKRQIWSQETNIHKNSRRTIHLSPSPGHAEQSTPERERQLSNRLINYTSTTVQPRSLHQLYGQRNLIGKDYFDSRRIYTAKRSDPTTTTCEGRQHDVSPGRMQIRSH